MARALIKRVSDMLPRSGYWKDVSWAATGAVLAQAINLVSLPLLTRLYAPADFAVLHIFTQAVAFAAILMTFRYEYAIQLPRAEFGARAVLRLVATLGLVSSVVLTLVILVALAIAGSDLESIGVGNWIAALPATAALLSVSLAYQHLAQRRLLYRQAGIAEAVSRLGYVAVATVGYFLAAGVLGLVLAVTSAYLVKIFALRASANWGRTRTRSSPRAWKAVLVNAGRRHRSLATSMVSSHIVMTANGLIASLYLAQAFGADTLGQFALVVSTTYLPSALIGSAIGQVYNQRAARSWADGESFGPLWRSTCLRLAALGIPMYGLLAAIAPWLYPFVFGAQWESAGTLASVMCLAAYFSYQTTPLDRSSLVVGAWWYLPVWHFARLIATALAILAAWHWQWSALQYILAHTLQMTLMYVIDFWAERNFAHRRPRWGASGSPIAGSLGS